MKLTVTPFNAHPELPHWIPVRDEDGDCIALVSPYFHGSQPIKNAEMIVKGFNQLNNTDHA